MGVFKREWEQAYTAYAAGSVPNLSPLAIQYSDFAAWQRSWLQGETLLTQENYWQQQLGDAPRLLELPTDYLRPAQQSYQGEREEFSLSKELTQKLKAISQQQGVSLFMTLLTAFNILLSRYSRQEDLCVGSAIANRTHSYTEGLIGFFVNTLVLRSKIKSEQSFSELLQQTRQTCLDAYAHQDIPFEYLVEKKREDIIQSLRDAKKSQHEAFDFQNIALFNNTIDQIFKDKNLEIDGLPLNLIRPVLLKSSTLQELKAFGEKYGIVVPRRLKKEQLLEVIYLELQSRGILTDDLRNELKKKSVVLIQRYAIDHDIKASTELKKDEIIEYILEFSHQTKAFYKYPQPGDYELEIDDPFEFEAVSESKEETTKPKPTPIPVIPVVSKPNKEKAPKTKEKDDTPKQDAQPKQQTQDNVVSSHGVPLVLDRQTAKFLKLYAISKNQKLIILPDTNYHKKRRTFKVQLDQLGSVSTPKKKHGLIGEFLILKLLALVILRTLIFVFAIAFVLGLLFVGYATASYFLNIEVLNTINDQINTVEFLGKGLLDHLFDLYRQIGI
jgi:hypothetical protein